jgi:hypothetical protein
MSCIEHDRNPSATIVTPFVALRCYDLMDIRERIDRSARM